MAVILQGQVTGELEVSAEDREMKGVPSTERTRKLREFYMSHRYAICSERSVLVTDSYKSTEALPPVIRQAKAFAKVLREMPIWIQEGELIVSRFAGEPTLDAQGHLYFVHHYYDDGVMLEVDIYVAHRR